MGTRILIGEDSPPVLNLLCRLFRSLGFEVTGVSDGGELMKQALAHPPDAIVMDMHMPVMDGMTLLRALHPEHDLAHVPVFFLSGSSDGRTIREATEAGAAGFFQKPGDLNRLARAVREALTSSEGDAGSES